jgi:hypothetical protein
MYCISCVRGTTIQAAKSRVSVTPVDVAHRRVRRDSESIPKECM